MPAKGSLSLTVVLLALLLAGCGQQTSVHQSQQFVFGTLVDIRIHHGNDKAAEMAAAAVMTEFDRLHTDWHPWQKDSALARINAALAARKPVRLPAELNLLVRRGLELARASGGLFDPAIGELTSLWNFHKDMTETDLAPPASGILLTWLQNPPSWQNLRLEHGTLHSEHPRTRLDFGAYAKGAALERATEILTQAGIANALVNAGGDLAVLGRHGERPWRIGVRDPHSGGVLASLDVDGGEALFTSGGYERGFHHAGQYYHHILDPRTARPATGTRSVTVLHEDAGVADAAATALFVAGPGAWASVAAAMRITHAMLVADDGHVEMTEAMQERIRFENDHEPTVVLFQQP